MSDILEALGEIGDSIMGGLSKAAAYTTSGRMPIDAACLVTTDSGTMELAKRTKLSGKPNALGMLDHYLSGGKTAIAVDTAQLFRDDPGLAAHFLREVKTQLGAGAASGNVPVKQSVYSNQDWRMALGSINLQWKSVGGGSVEVWFINRYRWNPGEKRITQCVHQAAENLKATGAGEFDMIGSHYTLTP